MGAPPPAPTGFKTQPSPGRGRRGVPPPHPSDKPSQGGSLEMLQGACAGTSASHMVSEAPGPPQTAWDSTNPQPHTALPTRSVSNKCQAHSPRTLETYGLCGAHRPLHQPLNSCVCLLSPFSHVLLFATPWAVARQVPLSMGFSKQEYRSGLPCPLPGIFPTQGSNLCLSHCLP